MDKPIDRFEKSSQPPVRLKRRFEFQNAAKGKRFHASAFTLQSARSPAPLPAPLPASPSVLPPASPPADGGDGRAQVTPPRFGLTVTKKIGNAVVRNRIRRRLKDALRGLNPLPGRPEHDYVIVAKKEALGMNFSTLQAEIARALGMIDSAKPGRRRQGPKP
ncbi:ribonuclease P protein component [Methylocapsa palsarum]|uniref:Ribonuclease P protein component n=1 Tax=Methylocapsa palsarum TaxID=1612308 RepID=A0A1I4BZ27_9HYPH|nr:ribonuclease P protein component [Methylocapsa palsarum]SFK74064.1 ribonuclease P protein component [Methylocapsa palsarum]